MEIRDATSDDMKRILALNNAEAEAVNAVQEDWLASMGQQAFALLVAGDPIEAFVLALSHETPAQGPNHAWFLARKDRFVYVDRVVVAPSSQRRGVARKLYDALEARALAAGIERLCCEVNLIPPNSISLAFHERAGFTPVGEATDPRNGKRVRYLVRKI